MEPTATVQELFKRWRNEGDAEAGMAMAQKFSDWYYAVTAARMGDRGGRQPLEAACQAFESGIIQVSRTSDLVDWASQLVQTSMASAGGRLPGGDFPNAMTGNRSPTALLAQVAPALPRGQVDLLAATFDASVDLDTLTAQAEHQGGMPHAILGARYALKRLLRDQAQVPFQVVPEQPNLDLAPLPVYEAARMTAQEEEAAFEQWLLSDIELCKDVAEFAAFAHALRAGAFRAAAAAPQTAAPQTTAPQTTAPPAAPRAAAQAATASAPQADDPSQELSAAPARKSSGGGGMVVFALVGLFVFVAVVAAAVILLR